MPTLNDTAAADIVAALGVLPEVFWEHGDDACDCTFQRIGMWTNPYAAETLEVRMCCIWEELYALFPQHVRRTKAFLDYNANEWDTSVREWDGEADMPRHLWYRQIAHKTGDALADVRRIFAGAQPPAGTPRPPMPEQPDAIAILWETVQRLDAEVAQLKKGGA